MSRRVGRRKLRVTKRSSGGYEVDPDRADYKVGQDCMKIRFALRNFITSAMSLSFEMKKRNPPLKI